MSIRLTLDYLQPATVPMGSETHAGDDVAIYAWGPFAHLFQGTVEENYIYHVLSHASGLGAERTDEVSAYPGNTMSAAAG